MSELQQEYVEPAPVRRGELGRGVDAVAELRRLSKVSATDVEVLSAGRLQTIEEITRRDMAVSVRIEALLTRQNEILELIAARLASPASPSPTQAPTGLRK